MTLFLFATTALTAKIQAVDLILSAELWKKFGMSRDWTDGDKTGHAPDRFSQNTRYAEINENLVKGDVIRVEQILGKAALFYRKDTDSQTRQYQWLGGPRKNSVSAQTAYLIYIHLVNQYLELNSDAKLIYHRLKVLEDSDLIGYGPPDFYGGDFRNMHDFMKQFKATAFGKSKGENEVEQAVLDLSQMETLDFEKVPHMLKVCKFGVCALPYLAAEIEGARLTKCFVPSYGKNQEMIVPVNYIAKMLVSMMPGISIGWNKMTKQEVLNLYRIEKLKLGKSGDTIAKGEKKQ